MAADKAKIIKISIAAVCLIAAAVILAMQFMGGSAADKGAPSQINPDDYKPKEPPKSPDLKPLDRSSGGVRAPGAENN